MGNAPTSKIIIRAKIARRKHSDDPKIIELRGNRPGKAGSDVSEIQEVLPLFMPITVS
jgi:hypothetical protein